MNDKVDIDYDFVDKYLSKFRYEDWEDVNGEDSLDMNEDEYDKYSRMQLGDFVILMFENSYNGDQVFHWARVVIDEDYGIPCLAVNEELDELDNSGEIWGVYETALQGAFFTKVSEKSWFENLRNL